MEVRRSFTASQVEDSIDGESPSERTVRNTLNGMESLGLLESDGGKGRAPRVFYPREVDPTIETPGYVPQASTQSGTFPYPGSKSHLSQWIVDVLPEHDTYVEVFGGSAGVLYGKPRSKYEIYNDINDDLTHFFTILRDRPDDLAEWLLAVPYSRTQYKNWVEDFYAGYRPDDPIERAGQFFSIRYMQHLGVSNTANGFNVRAKRSPARTFNNARRRIDTLARRFDDVTIENQHYREILTKYDDPSVNVLFYADPPYIGAEEQYNTEFVHEDFVDCLRQVQGDWIVSYSNIPDGLKDYSIIEHDSRHRMRRDSGNVSESLVCNFDPEDRSSFKTTMKAEN